MYEVFANLILISRGIDKVQGTLDVSASICVINRHRHAVSILLRLFCLLLTLACILYSNYYDVFESKNKN